MGPGWDEPESPFGAMTLVSSAAVDPHDRRLRDDPSDRINWVSPKSPALRKVQCRPLYYSSQSGVCFAERPEKG